MHIRTYVSYLLPLTSHKCMCVYVCKTIMQSQLATQDLYVRTYNVSHTYNLQSCNVHFIT